MNKEKHKILKDAVGGCGKGGCGKGKGGPGALSALSGGIKGIKRDLNWRKTEPGKGEVAENLTKGIKANRKAREEEKKPYVWNTKGFGWGKGVGP